MAIKRKNGQVDKIMFARFDEVSGCFELAKINLDDSEVDESCKRVWDKLLFPLTQNEILHKYPIRSN